MRRLKALSRDTEWVARFDALAGAFQEFKEIAEFCEAGAFSNEELLQETQLVEGKFRQLEAESVFTGPWDHLPAVLNLDCTNEDFLQQWLHLRFKELKTPRISNLSDEEVPRSLLVEGKFAFGIAKQLAGKSERWYKNPWIPDAKKEFVRLTMEVYPLIPDLEDLQIPTQDLRLDHQRQAGKCCFCSGRQQAVRATHKPTGFSAYSNHHRKLQENEALVLQMLKSQMVFLRRGLPDGWTC